MAVSAAAPSKLRPGPFGASMQNDPHLTSTLSQQDADFSAACGTARENGGRCGDNAGASPRGWLDLLLHAAVLAACSMAMANNMAEPDLWGHVQYARDAMRDGLPTTATYTYTAEGTPWINHELLSEYLFAVGVDTIGVSSLLIAKVALGLLVLSLVLRCALRKGISPFAAYFVAILTATNLTFFWVLRPQLFSLVFFALLLAILSWCFEGWEGNWQLSLGRFRKPASEPLPLNYSSRRMRFLWSVPVLMFVWANTHGAFLAGLCVFIAYLTLRGVEAATCRGRAAIGLLKRFAMMIAASVLATLINPYGGRLHVWLVESLLPPRPEIIEWLPPPLTWEVSSLAFLPFWLLLVLGIDSLVFSRKPKDFTHTILLAILAWQAVEHRRHIALLAIAFAYWMPQHVGEWLQRLGLGRDNRSFSSAFTPRVRWAFGGLVFAALAFVGKNLFDQTGMICVRRELYPVSAFQYVSDQRLQGKMVVAFDWAQYAIMAFGAESERDEGLRVHFDGRYDTCYPREIVDMNFDFEMGDMGPGTRYRSRTSPKKIDGSRLLEFNQPDLLLMGRMRPEPIRILAQQKERWVLLYQDELAQLWGRATKYDDPANRNYISLQRRQITDDPQSGFVAWPALPERPLPTPQLVTASEITARTLLHFPENAN